MNSAGPFRFTTRSPAETEAFGRRLGEIATAGSVILLHGDLGAGKTTLTKGIARALTIAEPIQSPTFTLVAEHLGRDPVGNVLRLYHLDLYRLADPDELESIGFDEYIEPDAGVTIIEWSERAGPHLPPAYLLVQIAQAGADTRDISVEAVPPDGSYERVVRALANTTDLPEMRTRPANTADSQ